MATIQESPSRRETIRHRNDPASSRQRRKERIALVLLLLGFTAVFALMIYLASLGPPPADFPYPVVP